LAKGHSSPKATGHSILGEAPLLGKLGFVACGQGGFAMPSSPGGKGTSEAKGLWAISVAEGDGALRWPLAIRRQRRPSGLGGFAKPFSAGNTMQYRF
jgi:hypothetical protein